jgi:succinyl-diaminopimelate desuccinylase
VSRLEEVLELVRVPSVSRAEATLATYVATRLTIADHLEVERVGDNVVARTTGHHATRLLVAGHLDTVPGDAALARLESGRVFGVGACDMKGSLAVMLELALDPRPRPLEVTWVFYAREEIARAESGLLELHELRPDLLVADAAILAEPTAGTVEAGCQGSLRLELVLRGERAHTARPFTGRNAIHRLAPALARVAEYAPREVLIDGIAFVEQLNAVLVEGGVAANVVPDEVRLTLNHRVAPDRDRETARAAVRELLGDCLEEGDSLEVVDWAPPSPPDLANEHLARLVELTGEPARGKVGWTDVATLRKIGVPAANFGAGDPLLAHRSDEYVTAGELDRFAEVLSRWLD